ncbi:MAG: hypothetical protein STSR0009_28660 [Methanoregula sp.]
MAQWGSPLPIPFLGDNLSSVSDVNPCRKTGGGCHLGYLGGVHPVRVGWWCRTTPAHFYLGVGEIPYRKKVGGGLHHSREKWGVWVDRPIRVTQPVDSPT